jgi:predicted MFS family arabinose efflux permease
MIAQAWLVLQLTDSGFYLGLVTGLQFLPTLLLGPWVSNLIDEFPKRQVLYVVQVVGIIGAALLGLVVALDIVQLWMVLALCLVMGITAAFEMPARQAFITEIVNKDHMQNAITLGAMEASMARIIGPALGALSIAVFSLAGCFFMNAGSFVAALVGLAMMRSSEFHMPSVIHSTKGRVHEALSYVSHHQTPRLILLMMVSVGVFACEFFVTLPLLAKETFGGDASTYASLTTAMGIGAVLGGLYSAGRPMVRRINTVALYSVLFGTSMIILSLMPTLRMALIAVGLIGFMQIMLVTTANSMLLASVAPEMRGRISVLWVVIFAGSTPLGGPFMGWIGQHFTPGMAIAIGGMTTIISGAWVLIRRTAPYQATAQETETVLE